MERNLTGGKEQLVRIKNMSGIVTSQRNRGMNLPWLIRAGGVLPVVLKKLIKQIQKINKSKLKLNLSF